MSVSKAWAGSHRQLNAYVIDVDLYDPKAPPRNTRRERFLVLATLTQKPKTRHPLDPEALAGEPVEYVLVPCVEKVYRGLYDGEPVNLSTWQVFERSQLYEKIVEAEEQDEPVFSWEPDAKVGARPGKVL